MKTLVIVNEPFAEMLLGKNTTLAYVLAAANFSDVYVQNIAENFCIKITDNQSKILTEKFKEINRQIRDLAAKTENVKAKNLIEEIVVDVPEITLKDLIIQRIEPMKAPFLPQENKFGEKNLEEFLRDLRKKFPTHIFNCPIGLHDKDLGEFSEISVPTKEFLLSDQDYADKVEAMGMEYEKIYKNISLGGKRKVVIKPKDLAQSLGVFALDLTQKKDVSEACFEHGEKFYRGKILVQPFLEGIRQGDVRATILKNVQGNFECVGYTFRKNIHSAEDENFTTGYVSGGSIPRPISHLSQNEQKDLIKKTTKVLGILNDQLREKYHDSIELGADFILVGNGHDLLLSEINHHCTGLIPVSEAMGDEGEYEGGLGFVKKVIVVAGEGIEPPTHGL